MFAVNSVDTMTGEIMDYYEYLSRKLRGEALPPSRETRCPECNGRTDQGRRLAAHTLRNAFYNLRAAKYDAWDADQLPAIMLMYEMGRYGTCDDAGNWIAPTHEHRALYFSHAGDGVAHADLYNCPLRNKAISGLALEKSLDEPHTWHERYCGMYPHADHARRTYGTTRRVADGFVNGHYIEALDSSWPGYEKADLIAGFPVKLIASPAYLLAEAGLVDVGRGAEDGNEKLRRLFHHGRRAAREEALLAFAHGDMPPSTRLAGIAHQFIKLACASGLMLADYGIHHPALPTGLMLDLDRRFGACLARTALPGIHAAHTRWTQKEALVGVCV